MIMLKNKNSFKSYTKKKGTRLRRKKITMNNINNIEKNATKFLEDKLLRRLPQNNRKMIQIANIMNEIGNIKIHFSYIK